MHVLFVGGFLVFIRHTCARMYILWLEASCQILPTQRQATYIPACMYSYRCMHMYACMHTVTLFKCSCPASTLTFGFCHYIQRATACIRTHIHTHVQYLPTYTRTHPFMWSARRFLYTYRLLDGKSQNSLDTHRGFHTYSHAHKFGRCNV